MRQEYFNSGIQSICPGCVEWDKSKQTMLSASEDLRSKAHKECKIY